MMLGLSLSAFTTLHVVISLVAMLAGAVALAGWIANRRSPGWTALFLATTIATSVTGFMFPASIILPSHIVGAISLVVLAVTLLALYGRHLSGYWRAAFVATAVFAFYLNVFVGVAQAFQKLGPLRPLAPTQSEPPFLVAQLVVLATFIALGALALKRFRA